MSDIPIRQRVVAVQSQTEKTSEEKLFDFVDEQIDKMKRYSNLGDPSGMPGFVELNQALMGYNTVLYSLQTMDVMAKQEAYRASEAFKDFLAEKYIETRNILNPPSIAASKWYSSSEIESYVRTHWHDEFRKLSDEKQAAESKLAFIRRLLDGWSDYKFNLNTLSKNIQTEAMQLMGSPV